MPWLVREVSEEIESIITSRDVITGTFRIVISNEIDSSVP